MQNLYGLSDHSSIQVFSGLDFNAKSYVTN